MPEALNQFGLSVSDTETKMLGFNGQLETAHIAYRVQLPIQENINWLQQSSTSNFNFPLSVSSVNS
jgi:hypothetical protein